MNSESRYATADSKFVVCHSYDATGAVDMDTSTNAPMVSARSCLYRLTTLPLPDPPVTKIRAKVTDKFHLLAKRHYNDPLKWWVLADANSHIRYPLDMATNDLVYIP